MAVYKQSVDFLPELSKEEKKEKQKASKAGLYAAILPLFAAIIWIAILLVSFYYKGEVKALDTTIGEKEAEIETYSDIRNEYISLIVKVEALRDLIAQDFYPKKFFDNINSTLASTSNAQAEVYAYGRDDDGVFNISGKANSYLDLAKVIVAFTETEEFFSVEIKSIRYDPDHNNINFEVNFEYFEQEVQEE